MRRNARPVSLAGARLEQVRHVCAFFATDEEEYRVLLPFIKDGIAYGDKTILIVNSDRSNQHLGHLAAEGIDVSALRETGQFEIQTSSDVYLHDGRFDQDRMMAMFESLASGNVPGPFPLSRIFCQMDWASSDRTRIEEVIEFESRVNGIWSQHDDVVVCTYQLSKFSGDEVIDIMRTHPMVIVAGILQENPFFTPPEEFLSELRARRDRRLAHPC